MWVYGLPKGVDYYLEFIIRDLNPQDKKPFLESYRSVMIAEFVDVFEPYKSDKNYSSEVSSVDYFCKNFLLKYRLPDIELRNDEEALQKVMSLIHPRGNRIELDEYFACMVVIKYYLEGRFSKLISKDKALNVEISISLHIIMNQAIYLTKKSIRIMTMKIEKKGKIYRITTKIRLQSSISKTWRKKEMTLLRKY